MRPISACCKLVRVMIPAEQSCPKRIRRPMQGHELSKNSRAKKGSNGKLMRQRTKQAIPGFEPGSPDSKSGVINHYTKPPLLLFMRIFLSYCSHPSVERTGHTAASINITKVDHMCNYVFSIRSPTSRDIHNDNTLWGALFQSLNNDIMQLLHDVWLNCKRRLYLY